MYHFGGAKVKHFIQIKKLFLKNFIKNFYPTIMLERSSNICLIIIKISLLTDKKNKEIKKGV